MTVTTTINRNDHIGDGSTTVFAYTFAIQQSTDMSVYLDGVLSASGYTVSINSNGVGGNVTFSTAPVDDTEVTLIREVDYTQETSLPHDANIPEETVEDAFDKAVMLVQQVKEITSRCLILPVQVTGFDTTFPDPRESPGYIPIINDDGDGLELKTANQIFNEMEGGGYGDVLGPASSVANGLPLFADASGNLLKMAFTMPSALGTPGQALIVNSLGSAVEFGSSASAGAWNCRLTLESGVFVSTSDQLAKTTLYVKGGSLPTSTGSSAKISGGEISKSLTGVVTTKAVDVYIRVNSGSDYDTVELVDWTDTATRASTPTYNAQLNAYFHATNTTWLWVGTILPSANGQCEVSTKVCSLFNYGSQVLHFLYSQEGTNSWAYGTNTWRAVNGGSTLGTAKVGFVCGLVKDPVFGYANLITSYVASYESARTGIGLNASNANSAQLLGHASPHDGYYKGSAYAIGAVYPALGKNECHHLEAVPAAGSVDIYGDNGAVGTTKMQSGMVIGHYY